MAVRAAPLALAVAVLAGAACLAACDVGSLDDSGPGPTVHDSVPADGAHGVSRVGPWRARFDERVVPRTVNRATAYVHSGPSRPLLTVWYDLLTQSVQISTTPDAPLEPDVDYELVVDNVTDLDGNVQTERYSAVFHTGSHVGPAVPGAPTSSWSAVAPIFTAHCTGSTCHGPGPAAVGLDLSSPEGVRATAVNVVARTLPAGTATREGAAGANGLLGMKIVDAPPVRGHPETSYLMYTVLGDPHVALEPMPPALLDDPAAGLNSHELRTLSDWIEAGAPTI